MDTEILFLPQEVIIYRFDIAGKYYVGSTKMGLYIRVKLHYDDGLKYAERKLYSFVALNGGWKEVKVIILDRFEFTTNEERFEREQKFFNLDDELCLNEQSAKVDPERKLIRQREANIRCRKTIKDDTERYAKKLEYDRKRREKIKENPELYERTKQMQREATARRRANPEKYRAELDRHNELRRMRELKKEPETKID